MVQKSSTWLTNGPTKTSPSPNTAVGTFWAHFDTNRGNPSELHGSTSPTEPTVRLSVESSTSPGTATSSPGGRSTSVKRSTRPLHRSVTMPAMSRSRQRTQIYWKRCGFTRSNGKTNRFWGSQDCRSGPTRSRHNPKPVRRGPRPMLTQIAGAVRGGAARRRSAATAMAPAASSGGRSRTPPRHRQGPPRPIPRSARGACHAAAIGGPAEALAAAR